MSPRVALAQASFGGGRGVYVTCLGITGSGEHAVAAFGDGSLRWMATDAEPGTMAEGPALGPGVMVLSGAADGDGRGFVFGTDDGRVILFRPGSELTELAAIPGQWIDTLAVHAGTGMRAFSAGRNVHVLDHKGEPVTIFAAHPSTPTGLAFQPDGKRLAVAHYGGVSVWRLDSTGAPEELSWHGSHTAISWSPDGRFIVTAMQENQMHCWRMPEAKSMRMSGYPKKIRALSWTLDSAYLAASGAEVVTSWPCEGDGPAGKAPEEFGYVYEGTVTHVAARPVGHVVAGGYDDGTVIIGDIGTGDAAIAKPGEGAKVTGLAWSPDGATLMAGTAGGNIAVMRVAESLA